MNILHEFNGENGSEVVDCAVGDKRRMRANRTNGTR